MFKVLIKDKLYSKLIPYYRKLLLLKFYSKYTFFRLFRRKGNLKNVYFATIQKSGSQWLKSIFSDPRILEYTKLVPYPQHNYDGDEFHKKFPLYTFVPGIYLSYPMFWKFVRKPNNYKVIYVIRDPRNIVVSWYHSVTKTHRALPGILKMREKMNGMSIEDGITYAIKHLGYKFAEMRSWVELGKNDDKILFLKFEDLISDSENNLVDLFKFLDIDVPSQILKNVIADYTKDKMRSKDLEKRKVEESHYRKTSSNFIDVFNESHYKLFNEINGNLIEILKYE